MIRMISSERLFVARTIEQRGSDEKVKAVIPGRAKREPGISRFPDVQLHI
jgi:hypothetical protein